jgi:hypothetical protein
MVCYEEKRIWAGTGIRRGLAFPVERGQLKGVANTAFKPPVGTG